jgi:hypothetical protein
MPVFCLYIVVSNDSEKSYRAMSNHAGDDVAFKISLRPSSQPALAHRNDKRIMIYLIDPLKFGIRHQRFRYFNAVLCLVVFQ